MNRALIIFGPTATGKTALAIKLAKIYNGEIISADSRQVYKGLDIGTGKLTIEQLNDSAIKRFQSYWIVDGIKIHGFDLAEPEVSFSVADFLKFTKSSIIQITKLKKLPIIVGGTGFYIKSLIGGLDTQGIPANLSLRKRLTNLNRIDLYNHLLKINPLKAKSMNDSDRSNPRRLIRAIEIAMYLQSTSEESEPTSEVNTSYHLQPTSEVKPSRHPENTSEVKEALVFGLTAPNSYLYKKVDMWLKERMKKGMVEEVANLIKSGVNTVWLEDLGLEYRWITRYLKGKISKDVAIERLKGDIHNFVRRQKTWFKQLKGIKIYDITKPFWENELYKDVELYYNSH